MEVAQNYALRETASRGDRPHVSSSSQTAHAIILTGRTCHHPHRSHMPLSTQMLSSKQHTPSSTQTAHAITHTDRTCHHPHRRHIYYPNRPHMPSLTQTTHAVTHTYVMSLLPKVNTHTDSPDWRVTMFGSRLPRLVSMSCASHARIKGNVEVWRNWSRQYLRKQNQGHLTPFIALRTEAWKEELSVGHFSFERTRMDRRQSDQR